jgi:hypothetical protein
MGYTHYMRTDNWDKQDKLGFEKALPIVQKILKRHKDIVQFECDDSKRPLISKEQIRFNGIGNEGHETFMFINGESQGEFYNPTFSFCKTARKPYDVAVCEVLLVLNAFCPNLSLGSDGFSGYLEQPELDGAWPEAVQNVSQYGIKYHTEVIEKREPYCDVEPVLDEVIA